MVINRGGARPVRKPTGVVVSIAFMLCPSHAGDAMAPGRRGALRYRRPLPLYRRCPPAWRFFPPVTATTTRLRRPRVVGEPPAPGAGWGSAGPRARGPNESRRTGPPGTPGPLSGRFADAASWLGGFPAAPNGGTPGAGPPLGLFRSSGLAGTCFRPTENSEANPSISASSQLSEARTTMRRLSRDAMACPATRSWTSAGGQRASWSRSRRISQFVPAANRLTPGIRGSSFVLPPATNEMSGSRPTSRTIRSATGASVFPSTARRTTVMLP